MLARFEKRTRSFGKKKQKTKPSGKGSTVPNSRPSPELIADGNLKRCSVCGYPFQRDVKPSMSVAFAGHLLKAHDPGQTDGEVDQPATRTVDGHMREPK
jgi:hypothetical protein